MGQTLAGFPSVDGAIASSAGEAAAPLNTTPKGVHDREPTAAVPRANRSACKA